MKPRCPGCRTRRASFTSLLKHVAASGHAVCHCGGYHHPHRPGSPCCEVNDWCAVRQSQRRGDPLETQMGIAADLAWDLPGKLMKEWPYDRR